MFPTKLALDRLPLSFLRQLALALSAYSRLQLRQCSRQLLETVDATGVRLNMLDCTGPTALMLCGQHVRAVDITSLQEAAMQVLLKGPLCSLPSLQELSCILGQLHVLAIFQRACPQLLHLRLIGPQHVHALGHVPEQSQQLPGVTSLTSLEMDSACHQIFTHPKPAEQNAVSQQQLLRSFVGLQRNLQSLVLQPSRLPGHGISAYVNTDIITESCWQAAIQPLTALTCLSMGRRAEFSSNTTTTPLPNLRQLRCSGLDDHCTDSWALSWVGAFVNLTHLDVLFCSAGEIDFGVLAQLQYLCELRLHHLPYEYITSSELAPMSACSQLTCLRLDSLVIEPVHTTATLGSALPSAACPSNVHHKASAVLPQLVSLKKLVAGLVCKAPVATLAPNLTQLRDLDYDLGELELPEGFVNEHPSNGQEALAGLDQLQLLGVNIFALVRHSAYKSFTQLPCLTDLHVEMVGNLAGTHLSRTGLPALPHLTKLVMTLPNSAKRDLNKTYTTEEDVLIWQNQAMLRHIRMRGTVLLGGFMVHEHLLDSMQLKLPNLRLVELVRCNDLSVEQLSRLVHSGVAQRIVVQGCAKVSARDCMLLQEECSGAITVECDL